MIPATLRSTMASTTLTHFRMQRALLCSAPALLCSAASAEANEKRGIGWKGKWNGMAWQRKCFFPHIHSINAGEWIEEDIQRIPITCSSCAEQQHNRTAPSRAISTRAPRQTIHAISPRLQHWRAERLRAVTNASM